MRAKLFWGFIQNKSFDHSGGGGGQRHRKIQIILYYILD